MLLEALELAIMEAKEVAAAKSPSGIVATLAWEAAALYWPWEWKVVIVVVVGGGGDDVVFSLLLNNLCHHTGLLLSFLVVVLCFRTCVIILGEGDAACLPPLEPSTFS